jgi:hypothetical protein
VHQQLHRERELPAAGVWHAHCGSERASAIPKCGVKTTQHLETQVKARQRSIGYLYPSVAETNLKSPQEAFEKPNTVPLGSVSNEVFFGSGTAATLVQRTRRKRPAGSIRFKYFSTYPENDILSQRNEIEGFNNNKRSPITESKILTNINETALLQFD